MAKQELGTKRIDPETGKKFYDLNKDPIVSPYTGNSYPRSFFESTAPKPRAVAKPVDDEDEDDVEDTTEDAEVISLEEADEETAGSSAVDTDEADEDVEIGDDADEDVFIEDDEEEGDDVSGIVGDVDEET